MFPVISARAKQRPLIAQFDAIKADEKDYERYEEQKRREKAQQFEKELVEIEAAFNILVTAHLLINGYHRTDSREWRKKRNGRK